jgi:uncharacterized NAD-dependent epimerase/dehydratase family protein
VVADFVAGAAERLVLQGSSEADIVLVEGQGALHHPAYSGVTLALLHGAAPAVLVLCHQAGRSQIRVSAVNGAGRPIPPLSRLREDYEQAAAWVEPARVVGLSLNTLGLEDDAARAAISGGARELGVRACDPVRFGAEPIADALVEALAARRAARGAGRSRATSA